MKTTSERLLALAEKLNKKAKELNEKLKGSDANG